MNLAHEYYDATCEQLVTLEEVLNKKGSSKSAIDRQYKICFDMIIVCSKARKDTPIPGGTTLWLLMETESPLRALHTLAIVFACDKHEDFVASLPYGGYNQE